MYSRSSVTFISPSSGLTIPGVIPPKEKWSILCVKLYSETKHWQIYQMRKQHRYDLIQNKIQHGSYRSEII